MNETRCDAGIALRVVPLLTKPVEPFVGTVYCGWFCDPDGTMRPEREELVAEEYAAGFLNSW